ASVSCPLRCASVPARKTFSNGAVWENAPQVKTKTAAAHNQRSLDMVRVFIGQEKTIVPANLLLPNSGCQGNLVNDYLTFCTPIIRQNIGYSILRRGLPFGSHVSLPRPPLFPLQS